MMHLSLQMRDVEESKPSLSVNSNYNHVRLQTMKLTESSKMIKTMYRAVLRSSKISSAILLFLPSMAHGETLFLPGCTEALAEGSANIFVEGKAASRVGDRGSCGGFTLLGSLSVSINGKQAVRVGDQVQCANGKIGMIRDGASSVFVEGRPLATAASRIVGCE